MSDSSVIPTAIQELFELNPLQNPTLFISKSHTQLCNGFYMYKEHDAILITSNEPFMQTLNQVLIKCQEKWELHDSLVGIELVTNCFKWIAELAKYGNAYLKEYVIDFWIRRM